MTIRSVHWGLFAVVAGVLSACTPAKQSRSDPSEQIVAQLAHRRIVMLGDFAHEFSLSNYGLTSALSTWLTMVGRGACDQTRLTLFIEEDEKVSSLVRGYLDTGDLNPTLDFLLPSTSVERLEFYAELRGMKLRIDSLNNVLPASRHITFDIQGPEPYNVFEVKALNSSEKEALLFNVRARDSLTAVNIVTYLRDHPDQKGLIFYGNGHLTKNIVRKCYSSELTDEESRGAYLGFYLKRAYGDEQVFTIGQVARAGSHVDLDSFGEKDVLLPSADAPWKTSPTDDECLVPENFDAFDIRNGVVIRNHPLRFAFSKRIVRASLARLEVLEPFRSGVFGNRFYNEACRSITFLVDTNFSNLFYLGTSSHDWKKWVDSHQFDGLGLLISENYRHRMSNSYFEKRANPEYLGNLAYLGFDARIGNPMKMSQEEWDKMFEKNWPQVIFLNAVEVSWIGDPDEQATAKKYLAEVSGHENGGPDNYLRSWRRTFYGVSY